MRSTIVGSTPGDWKGWYCSRIRLLARPDPPPPVSDEEPGDRGLSRLRALRGGGVVSASFVAAGGELLVGAALSTVLGAAAVAEAPRLPEVSRGGGFAGARPAVAEAPLVGPGAQLREVRRLPAEGVVASEFPTAAGAAADAALFPADAAADAVPLFEDALLFALA